MEPNFFVKSQGLGNTYIVLDNDNIDFQIDKKMISKICDVNYGIGSDGILLKISSTKADFGLRIFNPDGSEAEKSGNGLRIFSKYLYDYHYIINKQFTIEVLSGVVKALITEWLDTKASEIKIEMGKAVFVASQIPVLTTKQEVMDEELLLNQQKYYIHCVSVGNPHCVIIKDHLDPTEIKTYGPLIENHALFPKKINVQFAKIISRKEVEILIWERGAGYTLASGSSSCAVASVLLKKGLIDPDVIINMPGGKLTISIDDKGIINMTGPVCEIACGVLSKELIKCG